MRRVVITGIGLLTPLGQGTEITWKAILAGKSGAGRITTFDPEGYACQVACELSKKPTARSTRRAVGAYLNTQPMPWVAARAFSGAWPSRDGSPCVPYGAVLEV